MLQNKGFTNMPLPALAMQATWPSGVVTCTGQGCQQTIAQQSEMPLANTMLESQLCDLHVQTGSIGCML